MCLLSGDKNKILIFGKVINLRIIHLKKNDLLIYIKNNIEEKVVIVNYVGK